MRVIVGCYQGEGQKFSENFETIEGSLIEGEGGFQAPFEANNILIYMSWWRFFGLLLSGPILV